MLKMRKTSLEDAAGGDEHWLQLLGWMLSGLIEEHLENIWRWGGLGWHR